MAERAPLDAPAAPDDQDERSTCALLASLAGACAEHEVWRERLNGRWVCFVRHDGRTYLLLPLEFSWPHVLRADALGPES